MFKRGYVVDTSVPGLSGGTIGLKFLPNGKSDGVQDCAHVATRYRYWADRLFRTHLLAYLDGATQESHRARLYEYWSEDYPQG